MSNVIREDVISLSFDTDLTALTQLQKDVESIKKLLTGGLGDDAFDDLKKSANGAADGVDDAKKSTDKAKDSFDKAKQSAHNLNDKLTTLGKKGAMAAFNGLKKVASVSFKAIGVGLAGVATGLGKVAYETVQAYGEFEQLKGGMEKIFDEANQEQIMKDANNAYLYLGLSANDYLRTINDVGATFAATMGDQKGYETARTGMLAISDYASGTGKNIDLLSEKYTLITRSTSSYQSIADQFSGILPATSKDFLAQAKAAGYLDDKYTELTKVPVAEYQEAVSKMLKKGVENLGLTENTANEATSTVTGSLGMMKATWQNLLNAMGSGDGLDQCVDNMVNSVEAFANNVMPVAERALGGIGTVVERLVPIISDKLPALADQLLPPLVRSAVTLTKSLVKSFPSIAKTVVTSLIGALVDEFPAIKKVGEPLLDGLKSAGSVVAKVAPLALGLVAAFKGFKKLKGITSLFGGKSDSVKSKKGGIFDGLTNTFKSLAKTKTSVILKGMLNLGIILGGFAAMAAIFMAVAPIMAQLGDMKSILKVVAVMAALGIVGTALAYFAGIVSKIKVTDVLLGLANMAIMLAGMSALFLLIGAISLIDFDLKRVFGIVAIIAAIGIVGTVLAGLAMILGAFGAIGVAACALGLANIAIIMVGLSGVLLVLHEVSKVPCDYVKLLKLVLILGAIGTIGSALSLMASIVGIVPFPIVLSGLVNIGLVLKGLTDLLIKFGEFAQDPRVMQFVETGGQLLAKVFNVLGQCIGSIIGGIGEGISNSLPKIGENLGKFGENIRPLFDAMSGVDMNGVGAFFTALVGLLGVATGNEIIQGIKSFFGGEDESPLVSLGRDLGNFVTEAMPFFETVKTIPEEGFTKAAQLFECLGGIGNLPTDGGIGSWFTGTIDFEKLANGLTSLSDERTIGFFNAVSGIKQEAFDNGSKLFECLSKMGDLPNKGGVAEWFAGGQDYEDIANGLGALSGAGVKAFFTMTKDLKQESFDNATKLFECLSGMGDLTNGEGFWERLKDGIFGGDDEKTQLSILADELGNFGEKTQAFFASVNTLNVGNMNALWTSLKNAGKLTTENLSSVIDASIDDLVSRISKLPEKMGTALKNNSKDLSNGIVEMWKAAVKASVAPVNKLLDGANHILKEFGSDKKLISWEPYAKGTNGHKGGNALVNDGNGAELVQMPNGHTFIPRGRNVLIPNAPKGMKVLPADQTAQVMGQSAPTFRYKNGTGDLDIWSYYDNSKGLVDKIVEGISYKGMTSLASAMGKGMVSTFAGVMPAWVDKLFEENGQSIASYVSSKGVTQWLPTVVRALKMEGQYSALNVARTLFQMKTESGGNPKAINLWDSNAKKGIPSKGLMQVIDPTFKAYARSGFNKNIYDPLSNILASVRYAVARYGTLAKAYRGVGYANGGIVTSPHIGMVGEAGDEAIIPLSASKRQQGLGLWAKAGAMMGVYSPESDAENRTVNYTEHNTYAPHFDLTITGSNDDRILARKVRKWVQEGINDTFESMERKTTRLREV